MTDKNKKPESKKPESKNKVRIRPRFDRIKSRIPIPSVVKDMNEKIKKKKKSGKKDIFDIIENIIKTPFKIRGGDYEYKANGGMMNKRSSFMGGGIAYKGGGRAMKRGGKK